MHEQNPMPTPEHRTCAPLTSSGRVGVVMLGLAVLGWAAPSSAQVPQPVLSELPEVTIEVLVQQVTVLSVQKGQGSMIVDSPPANGGNFMLPTSTQMDAVNINEAGADIPVVRLETNVPISSLHLDFPRRNGFNRGCSESNPGATFFGEAVLLGGNPGFAASVGAPNSRPFRRGVSKLASRPCAQAVCPGIGSGVNWLLGWSTMTDG